MDKTKKLQMELPKEGRFISSEFPILRENLSKIDQAIMDVEEKIDEKAPSKHTHTIDDVADLEASLKAKMAADKTFTFADLSDVEGASDAANNYVLYKSSNKNFTFGSAVSLLGAHQHKSEDIVGLDEFRAKINQDMTAYGRLARPNEWQSYNKFTSKVTMSGGLELLGNTSLNLTHNNEVLTSLNATGSLLKGPLKVDGDLVYTKSEIDKLIALLKKNPVEILMTESGTIPWPEGVTDDTDIEICAWGAGGGGTSGNGSNGNGGEGGQRVCVRVKGWQLKKSRTAQIGRGGDGGSSYGRHIGYDGGDTVINEIIRAKGGNGGYGFSWGGASTDRAGFGNNGIEGNGGGGGGGYFSGDKATGYSGGSGGNGAILLKFFI
ncbi:Bgr_08870 family protein [Bartonella sp. B39]